MQLITLRQKAHRITLFVIVQCTALIGWIIVQSFFSLSPAGRALPFVLTILIEALWWIALLMVMLVLFLREYRSFVQSALAVEEANRKLREATNQMFTHLKMKEQSVEAES